MELVLFLKLYVSATGPVHVLSLKKIQPRPVEWARQTGPRGPDSESSFTYCCFMALSATVTTDVKRKDSW